jgi:hypothetical protein
MMGNALIDRCAFHWYSIDDETIPIEEERTWKLGEDAGMFEYYRHETIQ